MAYSRECVGCQLPFETDVFRRKACDTCRVGKNPTRSAIRKHHAVSFVGVDGESVNRPDGSHDYVMLSVGNQPLFNDGNVLRFAEIMSFLWQCHLALPQAVFVGFFLGYDFTQWERLLPEDVARSLITTAGIEARKSNNRKNPYPDCVVYDGWEFDTLNNRRWKMRPHKHVPSKFTANCRNRTCTYVFPTVPDDVGPIRYGETLWEPPLLPGTYGDSDVGWTTFREFLDAREPLSAQDYLYICDTGSFWQTSFLNVINPGSWSEPVCTEDEYALVRKGKNDRNAVYDWSDTSYFKDMATYNKLENDILARVSDRLNRGFISGDIKIRLAKSDWYGPGRAAQQWMNMLSERSSVRASDVYEVMPDWAVEACRASYYGGWFEIPMHGHIGSVEEYDINSAYPSIIATLPCLLHGTWTNGTDADLPDSPYVLMYGDVLGNNPYLGAMPHRDRQGRISRPHQTKGWYWLDEILASRDAGLVNQFSVDRWVAYSPCACPPPFDQPDVGITRMYDIRLAVGKETPQGKGLKLVYNSAYGKTAQSVGNPKFGNPFYASRITSGTRTTILNAIRTHPVGPSSVAMVATDGVYFTSPHPGLRIGTSLGTWETKTKHGMTLMMPGVYWDDKARAALATDSPVPVRSRGVSGKDIAKVLNVLDAQWHEFAKDCPSGKDWPGVEIPVGFSVVSAKSALHRGKWETAGSVGRCGCGVHPEPGCKSGKRLSGDPSGKRVPIPWLDGGVVRTSPYAVMASVESTPYDKSFGWEQHVLSTLSDGVTDDFEEWADFLVNGVIPGV